ncbi:MAG: hypothetical protein E6L09_11040 [Verrucomicrobia bacterium]|nr:MAG: hypothetical protein DME19_07185 [Verrucomicrobiota bacterium]TMP98795.1 MAG: hypothetical protein E6L09_11040 [Verrucomicrobiota bacterium]
MNPSPEQFDRLRQLLALKRYEQPPPRFFNHFSDKVIARIETEGLVMRTSLWGRLFPDLDAKPVLACVYGLVITGLLVIGLGVSQSLESEESNAPTLDTPWFAQTPGPAFKLPPTAPVVRSLSEQTDSTSSVIPAFPGTAPRFLFDVNQLKVERASYSVR